MKFKLRALFLGCLATAITTSFVCNDAMAQSKTKSSERIVFLGDSITQAGDKKEYGYVKLVRKSLTESNPNIEVIGAGISGHKVPNLQKRLQRDVLSKDPTTVIIYIGINDVWHSQRGRGTEKDVYESGLKDLVKRIQDVGSKVILCTPSMIGEKTDGSNPLDKMLDEYCDISRSVAAAAKIPMIDLRKAFLEYLGENNPENKEKNILTNDGVHLNEKGNQFVARQMLKGLKSSMETTANKAAESVLRHIVLFKFKDGLPQTDIDNVVTEFGKLKSQIGVIVDYEYGVDISEENLNQGFTHGFVVTFADKAGVKEYLPHPAHQAFVKFLDGKMDKVLVFDFMTSRVE